MANHKQPTSPRQAKQIAALPPLDLHQRYTMEEACAYLRTSRQSVYNLVKDGEIKVIREGKRCYVPGSEIARRSTLPGPQA